MQLRGLHLLLTYKCLYECDHCFVWGSPWQSGTMTITQINHILDSALKTESVKTIYFEGGEPFLYYPLLFEGLKQSKSREFKTGIVTNGYWANSFEDAMLWLEPLKNYTDMISISTDLFHYDQKISTQAENAQKAANRLGIQIGYITIAKPESESSLFRGEIPVGESGVMYRGRAVEKLIQYSEKYPVDEFDSCPHEDLVNPSRVHVDPLGNLHICQGLSIGNLFEKDLKRIQEEYKPEDTPIISSIHKRGPAGLVKDFSLSMDRKFADACHLCYQARENLRDEFPNILCPDQMYGKYQ